MFSLYAKRTFVNALLFPDVYFVFFNERCFQLLRLLLYYLASVCSNKQISGIEYDEAAPRVP